MLVDFIVYIVVDFVVVTVDYCLVLHCGFSFLLSSEFRFYSLDLGFMVGRLSYCGIELLGLAGWFGMVGFVLRASVWDLGPLLKFELVVLS